jgi:hypothetical protein
MLDKLNGLWGLIGVVIGGLLTFLSQYIFELRKEKKENRNIFLQENLQTNESLFIIRKALKQFQSFSKMDLDTAEDYDLEEVHESINYSSGKCSKVWFDFRSIIQTYFYKSINGNSFLFLDNVLTGICNSSMNFMDFEMLRTIHKNWQEKRDDFQKAIALIDSIENEYFTLKKKIIKKII